MLIRAVPREAFKPKFILTYIPNVEKLLKTNQTKSCLQASSLL